MGGLTHDAVVLYKFAVANPDWTDEDALHQFDRDRSRLAAAIQALHENRLFRRSVDPDRQWDAVGPKCALVDLVTDEEAKLREAQHTLLRAQEELLSLVPAYFDALRQRASSEPVDVFHGSVTAQRLLVEQARNSTNEVCVANSGHGVDDIRWVRDLAVEIASLRGDVHARFLLDHSVQAHPITRRHVGSFGQSGWHVRTVQSLPFHLILVDRSATFLPVPDAEQNYTVTVVRHPAVVESFRTAFERLWSVARPLVGNGRPGLGLVRDQLRVDILHHLAAGEKDEVIARRLGLSVRTCRRHIAAIMDELGATGRFQAGVLAQRLVFDKEPAAFAGG